MAEKRCPLPLNGIISPNVGRRELPLDTARRRGFAKAAREARAKAPKKQCQRQLFSAFDNILVDLQQLFKHVALAGLVCALTHASTAF
jgi:hypothetical protein